MITLEQLSRVQYKKTFNSDNYKFAFIYDRILSYVILEKKIVLNKCFEPTLENCHQYSMNIISKAFTMYINNIYKNTDNIHLSFHDFYENYKNEFKKDTHHFMQFFSYFREAFEIIYSYCERIIDNYVYINSILIEFQSDVKFFLNEDILNVQSIIFSEGDMHKDGKSTSVIVINNKRYFLKWRSPNNEILHMKLFEIIKQQKTNILEDKIHYENYLVLPQFTLEKEIIQSPTKNLNSLFYNSGIFLFVSYLLNCKDLHNENIIISDDNIYPIDSEVIFQYSDEFNVLNTGLLPSYTLKNKVLGAFSNNFDGNLYTELYIYKETVDGFILETSKVKQEEKSFNNSLTNIGEYYFEYKDVIKKGFKEAYKFYLSKRDIINNYILKNSKNLYGREIIKDTYVYSKAIWSSYTPYLLTKSSNRKKYFNQLNMFDEQEITNLLSGFIPVHCKTIDIPNNYFEKFSLIDMNNQLVLIDEAYRFEKLRIKDTNNKVVPTLSNFNFSIEKILEQSVKKLFNSKLIYKGDINWVEVIESQNDSYRNHEIINMNSTLYYGQSGIYLYLIKLFNFKPELKKLYKDFDDNLYTFLNKSFKESNNENSNQIGLLDGLSGNLLILIEMYKSNDYNVKDIEKKIIILVKNIFNSLKNNNKHDFLSGSIGFLNVLVKIYEISDCNSLKNSIFYYISETHSYFIQKNSIDPIINYSNSKNNETLFGYAHGIAGYLPTLYKTSLMLKDKESLRIVDRFFDYLLTGYESDGYWKYSNTDDRKLMHWCHGTPGIVLSLSQLYYLGYRRKEILPLINQGLYLLNKYTHDSFSLCHGSFGNNYIGLISSYYINNFEKIKSFENNIKINISSFEKQDLGFNKSFMLGYSGIFYFLIEYIEKGIINF